MQPLGYSLGYLYLQKAPVTKATNFGVQEILVKNMNSFIHNVNQLYWMDNQTKSAADLKASNVSAKIGYAANILNVMWLTTYYQNLNILPSDNAFNVSEKLIMFVYGKMFQSYNKPTDKTLFGTSPAVVNAYYNPFYNSITLPAGILQPPFFRADFPNAVNFGAFGSVSGHELTHGFDDEGSQFWANGTLLHWMTAHSQIGFNSMAQCIVNQYNQYCYPSLGICINGKNTQGENIADNGGIRNAYNSYMTWVQQHGGEMRLPGLQQYSMKQIFFMSFARMWCASWQPGALTNQILINPHSPARNRVLGTLMNFDAFGKAFSCKVGDPMYPRRPNTCYVWQSPPVSTSPGFGLIAKMLKGNIDPTANPCQNFYQYACGNYIKKNPPNSSPFGQSYKYIKLQTKINRILNSTLMSLNPLNTSLPHSINTTRTYFLKCRSMTPSSASAQQILATIKMLGGMPLFNKSWSATVDMGTIMGMLTGTYGSPTFFQPRVTADFMNPTQQMLGLDQANLILGAREFYLNNSAPLQSVFSKYKQTMAETLAHLATLANTTYDPQTLLNEVTNIWKLEISIAQAYIPNVKHHHNFTKLYNPTTLGQLTSMYKLIPWTTYFQKMLPAAQFQMFNQSNAKLILAAPLYTSALNLLFKPAPATNFRAVYNYVFWRYIYSRMSFLPSTMKSKYTELQKIKFGDQVNVSPIQDYTCINDMITTLPYTMGRLFISSWPNAPAPVSSMIQNVLQAYGAKFQQLDFLDSQSLTQAEAKIANMLINVGYPKWILNNAALDKFYSGFSLSSTDSAYTAFSKMHANSYLTSFNQLLAPTVRSNFAFGSPALVNAWYSPWLNSITFPAAILSNPYYNPSFPMAFNYGSIGYVMGHETGHAFDDGGVQFNSKGMLMTWMSPWGQKNFGNMAQCIINQYNQYCYPSLGYCVNGQNTQGENIADNGGIRQAYAAYWNSIRSGGMQEGRVPGFEGLSMDQIFFLGFANFFCGAQTNSSLLYTLLLDAHSPPKDRVTGTLQNFGTFGKAFNCPANSPMTPQKKCYIWSNTVNNAQGFKDAAAQLKYSYDTTVNPCQDFYKFSCGNWIKRTQIPPDRSDVSQFYTMNMQIQNKVLQSLKMVNSSSLQAFQKFKTLFNSCVAFNISNYTGNKQLIAMLNKFGGFPPIQQNWNAANFDRYEVMGALTNQVGISAVLAPQVSPDARMPTQNALNIGQTSFGTSRQRLLNASDSLLMAYKKLIASTIQILGGNINNNISNATAMMEANLIVGFEMELAKIYNTPPSFSNMNYSSLYNKFTFSSLVAKYPNINWTDYFQNVLPKQSYQQILSGNRNIIVSVPMYLNNLNGIMPYINPRTLSSYLLWRAIQSYMSFLSHPIQDALLEYRKETEFVQQLTPREQVCGRYVLSYGQWAASRLYIGKNYDPAVRAKMTTMINAVKQAYHQLLDDVPWLDSLTRTKAQMKAQDVVYNIAYPDFILDDTKLNNYYSALTVTSNMNWMQALQAMVSFDMTTNFNQLSVPSNRHNFALTAATVNAWYQPNRNSITFPAGILQPPFFRPDFPSSINFGGMGMVVGHEIGHGFDANGVHWYLGGLLQDWVDMKSNVGFQSSVNCLINQYNNFCEGKYCIDGKNYQFQNLADNIGIKAAIVAYYNWTQTYGEEGMLPGIDYTPQQAFYLNYGRIWCSKMRPQYRQLLLQYGVLLPDYRVNGPLMNTKDFGKTFNCPQGSVMNPDPMQPQGRCDVWGDPVSNSPGSFQVAKALKSAMNTSASPCNDFYNYACGNWLKNNPVGTGTVMQAGIAMIMQTGQALDAVNSSSPSALEKAKQLYTTCVNSSLNNYPPRNGNILKSLNNLGGWPPITVSWSGSSFNMWQIMAKLQSMNGLPTLMGTVVLTDWKTVSQNALFINQASLALGSRQYYLSSKFSNILAAYRKLLTNVTVTLAADANVALSSATVAAEVDRIINFETRIANISVQQTRLRNFTQLYNKYTISAAMGQWKNINFQQYLSSSLSKASGALTFVQNNGFVVLEPSYMTLFNEFLAHETQRPIASYLLWRYIYSNLEFLDYRLSAAKQEFTKILNPMDPMNALPPPRGQCIALVTSLMPWAAGRLYLQNSYYQAAQKQMIQGMTNMITMKFKDMLKTIPWLDVASQNNAFSKVANLAENLGYPSWIMNNTLLNKYYQSLQMANLDNFWDSLGATKTFFMTKQYVMLGQAPNRQGFGSSPATVDAWYSPFKNSLTIPAGILQPPFFSPGYPMAVNFGAIGAVIGHELTHAFDDEGSQFFVNGVLQSWLDPSSQTGFSQMAQCVIKQYSQYCYQNVTPSCINGVNTQGENIADNGGIRAAFYAYQKFVQDMGPESLLPGLQHYTMNQIFFLSFGHLFCQKLPNGYLAQQLLIDPHSPGRYRVIGSLQNFPEFKKAFQCPTNSYMAPANKCNVWSYPESYKKGWADIGKTLSSNINKTGQPCQDFFNYACGNWIKTHSVQRHQSRISTATVAVEQIINATLQGLGKIVYPNSYWPKSLVMAKMGYDSCRAAATSSLMNTKEILNIVTNLGGWPPIVPNWSVSKGYNLFQLIGKLNNVYGIPTLLNAYVDADWKTPTFHALYVDQISLALGSRLFYLNQTVFKNDILQYKQMIFNTIKLLSNVSNVPFNPENAKLDADDIFNVEAQLAPHVVPPTMQRNYTAMYHPTSGLRAQIIYNNLNVNTYLKALLPPLYFPKAYSRFIITQPSFMAELNGRIAGFGSRRLATYLLWRLLMPNLSYMGQQFRDIYLEFKKVHDVVEALPPSPLQCASNIINGMPYAGGRLYITNGYNMGSTPVVSSMISMVLNSFNSGLSQLKWIDNSTLAGAHAKVANIVKNVGFPPWILINSKLDAWYQGLSFTASMSWFDIQEKMTTFQSLKQWEKLDKFRDRTNFDGTPAILNAWYAPERNSITFPAGILQPPFFRADFPMAVNFGGIGIVMGHELSHGFDDEGVQFNGTGYLNRWMDAQSYKGFKNMSQCVVNEYSKFCFPSVPQPFNCINGINTQGENIADNGGIKGLHTN